MNCLRYFQRGFCYAINNQVFVFEKDKTYLRYTKKTVLTIPIDLYPDASYEITHVSVNITMDTVIAVAKHSQIYIGMLFVMDAIKLQQLEFRVLGEQLHTLDIVDISSCLWRPIFMTAGEYIYI